MRVRVKRDLPVFLGEDLKEYGPFKAGDLADLPPQAARVLLRHGAAALAQTILDWLEEQGIIETPEEEEVEA